MCGIAGKISIKEDTQPITRHEIERMTDMILHRGPDDKGCYINQNKNVGFGFTRLGLIDMKSGHQPMISSDKNAVIVLNGEIYDYKIITEKLKKTGSRFNTKSDTEALLNLYLKDGYDAVKHINGEFACAIEDKKNKRVILARDRFGTKPLYYCINKGYVYFASEIKSILAHPAIEKKINLRTVIEQMMRTDSLSRTFFENIQILKPGYMLIIENNRVSEECFYSLSFPCLTDRDNQKSLYEYAENIHTLLKASVKRKAIADFEMGCFLSGGLDSSIIAALLQEELSVPLKTFSIKFTDTEFDESHYADIMAQHINSDHTTLEISELDLARNFAKALYHCEHLVQSTDGVGKYLLSLEAKKSVKVVMTGEGADEVFIGYPWFKTIKSVFDWDPKRAQVLKDIISNRETAKKGLDLTESEHSHVFDLIHTYGYYAISSGNISEMEKIALNLFSADMQPLLKKYDARDAYHDIPSKHLLQGRCPISQNQYEFIKTTLPYYIFKYLGGKSEMAASLEGRLPFFDNDLFEYAIKINPQFHLSGLQEKKLLHLAFDSYLPDQIKHRIKHGYSSPILSGFLHKNGPEYFRYFLEKKQIDEFGIFDYKMVQKMLKSIESNQLSGQERTLSEKAILMIVACHLLHEMLIKNISKEGVL